MNRSYPSHDEDQSSLYDPYGQPLSENCYYDAAEMDEDVLEPYYEDEDPCQYNYGLQSEDAYDKRTTPSRLPKPTTTTAAISKTPTKPTTNNQKLPAIPTTTTTAVPTSQSNGRSGRHIGGFAPKPPGPYKTYQPPANYGLLSTTPLTTASTSYSTSTTGTAPQQIMGGISTFTKTLSSMFSSKTPTPATTPAATTTTAAAATTTTSSNGGLSFAAKFMQTRTQSPSIIRPTFPTSHEGVSNYCDEDYYNSIGGGNANPLLPGSMPTVDYGTGDDTKFHYDDLTETDYIAAGDLTDVKNHYNNNYPDYGCVAVEPRLIGDPDDDLAFSGGLGQGRHKHQQQQIDNISYSYCDSNRVVAKTPATTTGATTTVRYQPNINSNSSGAVTSTGGTVVSTVVAAKSGAMLIKQQPTVLYDEDDEDYDSYMRGVDEDEELEEEEFVEYMDDHVVSTSATTSSAAADGSYYTTPSTSVAKSTVAAPYYNYQVDSFNEEDEYKYLEEQEEPVEFYHENDVPSSYNQQQTQQNGGSSQHHGVVDDMLNSAMVAQLPAQGAPSTGATKKKHLAAQDSIDDNEFFMKHSKNQLTINTSSQHDVIREEDDECLTPIGSTTDDYYLHQPSTSTYSPSKGGSTHSPMAVASPPSSLLASTTPAAATPSLLLATTTATTSSSIIGGITASTAAAAMAAATSTMNHIADIGGGGAAAANSEATTTDDYHSSSAFHHHQPPMPMLLLDNGNSSVASLLDPAAISAPEKKKIGLGMAIGEMGMTVAGTTGMVGRKSEITAKQRWNWAYNKIIMQLNVSRHVL